MCVAHIAHMTTCISHIAQAFQYVRRRSDDADLQPLFEYVRRTWIESEQWPPASWSVYRVTVRTNDDVEGWHRRLNITTRPHAVKYSSTC